jgi:hypothetical protein
MARNITFNVAPRYGPGSPAAVSYEIAFNVARNERENFERARERIYGEADKAKAETQGLDLICFEMQEVAKGWNVHDLITGKQWFWPFEGRCPGCRRREPLTRGVYKAHVKGNPLYTPCAADRFMGKELKDEFRFRSFHEMEQKEKKPRCPK